MELNFTPFPELTTERLVLKRIQKSDAEDIFKFRSDEGVMRFIPRPLAKTIEDAEKVYQMIDEGINNLSSINWGLYLKENNRLIGIIGYVRMSKEHFRAEVGYVLHRDFHNKGLMYEALKEVIDYGFNGMKLNSIEAIIDPDNKPSQRLIEKMGFVKEGHIREHTFHNNKFSDVLIYSKLKRNHDGH
jgi:ribosomal-protein-alanine N-acetyltransferase